MGYDSIKRDQLGLVPHIFHRSLAAEKIITHECNNLFLALHLVYYSLSFKFNNFFQMNSKYLLMRTSPRRICTSHALRQVTSLRQLGLCVCSDSVDHLGRNRTHLPPSYDIETRHLWCVGKLTMEVFFWFGSYLRKLHGSSCITVTRCCVTSFGPGWSCIMSGLKPMFVGAPWSPPNSSSQPADYRLYRVKIQLAMVLAQKKMWHQTSNMKAHKKNIEES